MGFTSASSLARLQRYPHARSKPVEWGAHAYFIIAGTATLALLRSIIEFNAGDIAMSEMTNATNYSPVSVPSNVVSECSQSSLIEIVEPNNGTSAHEIVAFQRSSSPRAFCSSQK